jgi:toxin CcdB
VAQFDVLRVTGNVLVLDCQADLLADLPTRFVVPLRASDEIGPSRLTPLLRVGADEWVMVTPLARAIGTREVQGMVANLSGQEWAIKAALDMLISGF